MEEILGGPGSGKTTSSIEIARLLLDKGYAVKYVSITNVSIDDVKKRVAAAPGFKGELLENLQTSTLHSYMLSMIQGTNPGYEVKAVLQNEHIDYPDLLTMGGCEAPEDAKTDWRLKLIKEGIIKTGDKERVLLPMDRLMSYIIAFGIQAPEGDALIIDEYQDMNSYEINAMAELFGDRAVVAGDFNQSIFLFRHKVFAPHLPLKRDGEVRSYRFHQNTCDLLNRFIDIKQDVFPSNATAKVKLFSEVEAKSKINMYRSSEAFTEAERFKDIASLKPHIDAGQEVAIITTSNFLAAMYSAEAMKVYGSDNFENWYVLGSNVPIYWHLRDHLLQFINGKGVNATVQTQRLRETAEVFVEVGKKLGIERTPQNVTQTLSKILDKAMESNLTPRSYVSLERLKETLNALANGDLTQAMAEIPHACSDAKLSASRTILEDFLNIGFKAARRGVRLWRGQHRKISALTIHGSKGCEFDHTLVRFSTRPTGRVLEFLQSVNEIYVALSRHKLSCDVKIPMASPTTEKLKAIIKNIDWNKVHAAEHDPKFYQDSCKMVYRSDTDLLYSLAWLANRPNGNELFARVKYKVIQERVKSGMRGLPPGIYKTEDDMRRERREMARIKTQQRKAKAKAKKKRA